VLTENFAVHHDLPCIHGKISIVETPVELLSCDGLVRGIMVRRDVLVCQGLRGVYPFPGIEDEHFLEKVQCYMGVLDFERKIDKIIRLRTIGIIGAKLLAERNSIAFWQALHKAKGLLKNDDTNMSFLFVT
jgi:hypothetical protein